MFNCFAKSELKRLNIQPVEGELAPKVMRTIRELTSKGSAYFSNNLSATKFWFLHVFLPFSVLSICSAMYSRNIDLEFARCHCDIRIFIQKMKNLILALLSPAIKTSCQSQSYTIPTTNIPKKHYSITSGSQGSTRCKLTLHR